MSGLQTSLDLQGPAENGLTRKLPLRSFQRKTTDPAVAALQPIAPAFRFMREMSGRAGGEHSRAVYLLSPVKCRISIPFFMIGVAKR